MKKQQMTHAQALARLKQTRDLTTGLLKPLNIGFEAFLSWSRVPQDKRETVMDQLIAWAEKTAPDMP